MIATVRRDIELENERSDVVLTELRALRDDFRPTYETRDEYDVLVDRYIHSISESPVEHTDGDPLWSHETGGYIPPERRSVGEPSGSSESATRVDSTVEDLPRRPDGR